MRNLKLQYSRQIKTSIADVKFILINPNAERNSDVVYLVTDTKLFSYNISAGAAQELTELPNIISAEYLALDNVICLASEDGEVIVVNTDNNTVNEGTFCDVGILCMAWSPDQEIVVFVTKNQNIVVMNALYDPIEEHSLAVEHDENQFVNVGWGKKETQFHGSEGKTAAKQKSDFIPPTNIEELPQNVEISWRADGAYFTVSFVSSIYGRMFKVFDREGQLCFKSEKLNNLYPPIAWRPTGNWIAMPHRFPNKSTIALFEKNGLRHREIVLPFDLDVETIQKLSWSSDSDILMIETKNEAQELNNLYLYTIGNYHWYLKQVLSFELKNPISTYNWDNRINEEKTLHVTLQNGKYIIYRWQFGIDKYEPLGIVAVIDGKKLLLTEFFKSVVPPPMCSKELNIEQYINACTINRTYNALQLCIYDAMQKLHIYSTPITAPLSFEKQCMIDDDAELIGTPCAYSNLIWFNEYILLAATSDENTSTVKLIKYDNEVSKYRVLNRLQLKGIINIVSTGSAELDTYFVQTINGKIYQISISQLDTMTLDKVYVELDQPADQLQWYSTKTLNAFGLISLKTNQCLYIDAKRIAGDVTSFCMAGNYLAFTKLNVLTFLRLKDRKIVDERKIERGGKLITTTSYNARTVLQMPRGNLETICPRVLSLEIVGALLEKKQYKAALDMLRKERINLNIICDHNMNLFMNNLNVFLDEIQNPNWLNLFLNDLLNEDFSKTMYASNYNESEQLYPADFVIEEKVVFICKKLCALMEKSTNACYRLPIITAYVKMGNVEKALSIIWQQKERESAGGDTESKQADESLRYLLYMVDVNDLYNVALGTYDFGVVLFVAQKSQKDPKEFLPFLNELKTFEENYRKFKIDEYLKRYEKALHNIAACGADKFEESLAFIKQHNLYRSALKCYENQAECYKECCLAYADYLRANGKLENASVMYERGGNLQQALLSAKHVLDWQRVLILAQKSSQDVGNVALSLVPSLVENGKYVESYELHKKYGDNFKNALQYLIMGKLFNKAIYETRLHSDIEHENLIETVISPALLSYYNLLEANITSDKQQFLDYKQRLLMIRENKVKQQNLEGTEEQNNMEIDECDLLSDTTSMRSSRYTGSSRGTGKTFRSSKNRRKHERKLLSLKPGNPFEDIALIDALYNLITTIVNQQQNIHDTCKALIELQQDVAASKLQKAYKQLLELITKALDEIWIPEIMTTQQFLTGPNIDYTQLQNEQRYALINPQKRFKPQLNIIEWEHEILQ